MLVLLANRMGVKLQACRSTSHPAPGSHTWEGSRAWPRCVSPLTLWQTGTELPAPAWPIPDHRGHLGSALADGRSFFLSISLCNSDFQNEEEVEGVTLNFPFTSANCRLTHPAHSLRAPPPGSCWAEPLCPFWIVSNDLTPHLQRCLRSSA